MNSTVYKGDYSDDSVHIVNTQNFPIVDNDILKSGHIFEQPNFKSLKIKNEKRRKGSIINKKKKKKGEKKNRKSS